jgi:hypothetical protein
MEPNFWELKFGVEVSAMYHDWRRSTIISLIRFAKAATFFGAIATLITAIWEPPQTKLLLTGLAVLIAVVNLWELKSGWDELALEHTELYRRFSELLARMVQPLNPTPEMLHEWAAVAAMIRKDEPPTLWGVYTVCWNQVMERHYGKEATRYYRKMDRLHYLLRNIVQFQPADFPLASEGAAVA